MSRRKIKFVVAFLVVVVVVGYLLYMGASGTMAYYYTPKEVKAKGASIYGKKVRVGGKVVKGSIDSNPTTFKLRFKLADKKDASSRIIVYYQGVVPDTFKDDVEAIVEGTYSSDQVFKAEKLLAKCPSKYAAKKQKK